jgi:hypothetical protein
MSVVIQHKRGTEEEWTTANPVLAIAEIGFNTTNNRFKFGDGATAWNDLEYQGLDALSVSKRHTQSSQQLVWTITHNLGFAPNVTTTDINGGIIEGDIDYVNDTTITVTFSEAYSGYAYLS